MKKILFSIAAGLIIVSLTACGGVKEKTERDNSSETGQEVATSNESANENKDKEKLEWPQEYEAWGIPTIKDADVSFSDNKSVVDGMMVQGLTASVNLEKLEKADFDAYSEELIKKGFVFSPESIEDIMEVYEKDIEGGVIKVTLSFSEDITTIIANNSTIEAQKQDGEASGDSNWPTALKNIPEFAKGDFKETIDMGGGFYTITYSNITSGDIAWYKEVLQKDGFSLIEDSEEVSFGKMDGGISYAVGFIENGDTLQLMVAATSY